MSFLLFAWSIGGLIFAFNLGDSDHSVRDFVDQIKSGKKKFLFILLVLLAVGPITWAIGILAAIIIGFGYYVIMPVFEFLGRQKDKCAQWFTS